MTKDTTHFKKLLESERKALEIDLKTVARQNPENPSEWDAVPDKLDTDKADDEEVAERVESYEENTATASQLETRLNEVEAAIDRINDGTYGVCSECGKKIEIPRLEANPAATTCIAHKEL